ncbi:MAG: hypothetical protein Ct9H300mP11_12520 [Chloroflexota bacterium]|nr:MAG: hypothetical protein Ct9H300mP11_12520 [Chloroflexota bacterium]
MPSYIPVFFTARFSEIALSQTATFDAGITLLITPALPPVLISYDFPMKVLLKQEKPSYLRRLL